MRPLQDIPGRRAWCQTRERSAGSDAWSKLMVTGGVEPTQENLTSWIKAGVFCVGMGSKLFPKDKVAAEDWTYVTEKCKEALGYIAEARK